MGDTLSGSLEGVVYTNPENGYTVLHLRPDRAHTPGVDRAGLVTAVGNLPEVNPGEHLTLSGQWITHAKFGKQFQIESCQQTLPATVAGIQRYLGSGLVKGIGPRLAERIVARFGLETLAVIEENPARLAEVPDIGRKRIRMIAAAWEAQKQVKEIMLFLHSHAISTTLAVKIYKQYGDASLEVVQTNPYQLARDVYGIGFKTADQLARKLGMAFDHPGRIAEGIAYVLGQDTGEGHVFSRRDALIAAAADLLDLDPALIPPALETLAAEGRIQLEALPPDRLPPATRTVAEAAAPYERNAVYLMPFYVGEVNLAARLKTIANALPSRLSDIPPAFVRLDPQLSPEQGAAIRSALSHPLSVLTGGPGTGKTTALKAFIRILEEANKPYALASPTGRAAKRLSQATDRPAMTLHRLLAYSPREGFGANAENQLPVDMVIVDEASMLDLLLANHLLKALQPGAHLLLVGDVDQLPSVGAGDVLRDVIASGIAPVTRLSVIFRQAAHSRIITSAHRINAGQMPDFATGAEIEQDGLANDFFFFQAETPEEAASWVRDLVLTRIPQRFGLHPLADIQVLAPMYRGAAGVNALNEVLQAALNPPGTLVPEKRLNGQTLRVGDKLMQTQNNYDKDVFNGDIGYLRAIDPEDQSLLLDFEGRQVSYDWSEADQLVLAYAISVHKAQGSEFPAVVMPLLPQHYMMLQRNLLYTGVTRARQLGVLVGSKRSIAQAVRNNQVARRCSALDWRLAQG